MTALAAAAGGSQSLWLISRASGLILLLLFSVVVALGVATRTGASSRHWPKFAALELHRTLSLFAIALLALHVATAVLDPYVSISALAAVVPFTSGYERTVLGLGTLAVDLGAAVLISSVLRHRLGHRTWRAIHYLAYLAWPVAFIHAIRAASYDQHLWWVTTTEWASLTIVAASVIVALMSRNQSGPAAPPADRAPDHTRRPVRR